MRDSDEEYISKGNPIFWIRLTWAEAKKTKKPIFLCYLYEQMFGFISLVVQFHPEGNPG